ncbi:hypothetical protein BDR26DRAFT_1010379 [Obelidium mucronatum]|nr:hypothetical protein BDR26DRAFT_1010379 [Obelidium mucronatum]
MSSIYNNIGICPQFDILWSDLNVPEHLYFYARLMGVSAKDERAAVDKYLETVSLKSLEKRLASQLSGGEKRRLSIVALNDLEHDSKEGKTIILTTHSMEEAEALCQKIGIMAKAIYKSLAQDTDRACHFIESILPVGWRKIDSFATSTAYEFPAASRVIPRLFERIEQ